MAELYDRNGEPLRKWYSRKIKKPYINEDQVCINLYTPIIERELDLQDYAPQELRDAALDLILDFYGKERTVGGPVNLSLASTAQDVFFPKRPLSNPIVKFSVSQLALDNLTSDTNLPVTGEIVQIKIKRIKKFLDQTATSFKVYEQQLKFFDGSISPHINFIDLLDKTRLFFSNLENFVEFNGYSLQDYDIINIGIDTSTYQVTGAFLTDSDLKQIVLPRGREYYFSTLKQGSNKYVVEIVSHFNVILGKRHSQINWTQFLDAFLSDSGIVVNFFGRPRTNTEAHKILELGAAGPFGPVALTQADRENIQQSINDRNTQQRAFDQAEKKYRDLNTSLQNRLDKIVGEIQNMVNEADKVSAILNKYNVGTLVEAALECLLYKTGVNGAVPDFIPGINPLAPVAPRISLRFPAIDFKLPIISVNKALQIQIEEGLKRAALSAVMGLIQTVADLIRQICLMEPSENDVPSTPPQNIIWPPGSGPNNPLYDCYADFGFLSNEVLEFPVGTAPISLLESYLNAFAPLITARELCDLFGGVASLDVFQVANNLIDTEFPDIRSHFPDSEAIEQFFSCLGELVDPSYCQGVYNDVVPPLPDVDPCTIEDVAPFQDLVELLENLEDLYNAPDMSCGAGIVPALNDIASYNHAVMNLIDSILSPVQQTFVNDLGNFKSIILQPAPLSTADQLLVDQHEELLSFLSPPTLSDEQAAEASDAADFFQNLIPTTVTNTITSVGDTVTALQNIATRGIDENLQRILADRGQVVAPKTREFYQAIENNFATSLLLEQDPLDLTPDEAATYYSFLSRAVTGAESWTFGRIITYILRGGKSDIVRIYNNSVAQSIIAQSDLTYGSSGLQQVIPDRKVEAGLFRNFALSYASSVLGNDKSPTTDTFIKKYYPFAYFSLINLLAYRTSNSELFNADEMEALSLFPRVCEDGSISNADLLDINKIKQEALQEFVDNSCIDRQTEMGPVRDAGIMALVNAYLQTIVVDLVLKNIFLVNKFGIGYLADSAEIINELLYQSTHRIVNYIAGIDSAGETYEFPEIVKKGAAVTVKKIINRNPETFALPIGELTVPQQNFIQENAIDGNIELVSIDDPELQEISLRYLFETRIQGAAEKIRQFFDIPYDNTIEAYLDAGIPHTEIPDFRSAIDDTGPSHFLNKSTHSSTDVATRALMTSGPDPGNPAPGSGIDDANRDFFTLFNYIHDGKSVRDLYLTEEGFIETATGQKVQNEIDAILKYGALAMERYVRVKFDAAAYDQFLVDNQNTLLAHFMTQLGSIKEFFANEVPLGANIPVTETFGAPSAPEYLISFDSFTKVFRDLPEWLSLAQGGGLLPLPFYLAGYHVRQSSNWADVRGRTLNPLEVRMYVGDPDFDSSTSSNLSDYDLIKGWADAIGNIRIVSKREGGEWDLVGGGGGDNSGESSAGNLGVGSQVGLSSAQLNQIDELDVYENFGLFSLDDGNRNLPDFDLQAQFGVGSGDTRVTTSLVPLNDAEYGGAAYEYYGFLDTGQLADNFIRREPIMWLPWVAQSEDEGFVGGEEGVGGFGLQGVDATEAEYVPRTRKHSKGNWLFNIGLFNGAKFGPLTLDVADIDSRNLNQENRELIAQSKNFKIVAVRHKPYDEPERTFLTIRRKGESESYNGDTGQGGSYSSVDFFSGDFDNVNEDADNYQTMKGLFEAYSNESELLDALGTLNTALLDRPDDDDTASFQSSGGPAFGNQATQYEDLTPDAGVGTGYIQEMFTTMFPSVFLGSRIAYLTPSREFSVFGDPSDPISSFLGTANSDTIADSHKSFFAYGTGNNTFAHIATDKKHLKDISAEIFDGEAFEVFVNQAGVLSQDSFARYMEEIYLSQYDEMLSSLASQLQSVFGSNKIVDLNKVLQYLYIGGELTTYYSLFQQEDIFTDTKQTLLLALQAAFAGSDYTATSNCDVSALQNVMLNGASSALSGFGSVGNSFMNRMLKDTPKHILKGLVELTEPHVIVSKVVEDASRQTFQGIEQAEQMIQSANQFSNILGNLPEGSVQLRPSACDEELGLGASAQLPSLPELPPGVENLPTLDDLLEAIRSAIDNKWLPGFPAEMKPKVDKKKGIILEGSLPYTLFLPPITPFGILYLLLRLGEFGQEEIPLAQEDDCE
tara:strand:- start:2241 stop:8630 length:6390 start_codon:yes stop_codon:yes gene_type:complete